MVFRTFCGRDQSFSFQFLITLIHRGGGERVREREKRRVQHLNFFLFFLRNALTLNFIFNIFPAQLCWCDANKTGRKPVTVFYDAKKKATRRR
jgi:hypothetical protein